MRVGRHMPTNSKMVKAAELAQQIGCEAIQIFVSNPTGWRTPTDDPKTGAAFAQATRELGLDPVVIHAPYLINLGTQDPEIWEKSITLLAWTLRRGDAIRAKYVVFHTGSHRGAGIEAGVARIAAGIVRVLEEAPRECMLLLENSVGAGSALGAQFEHLAMVLELLPAYRDRLGVCLDTAHLWGAGHDIGTTEAALQVLEQFDAIIGLDQLKVLHLNDTEMALGSHRDVHARLGEGIIGEAGLQAIMSDPRLKQAVAIMETPIKTYDDEGKEKEDWIHDAGQIAKAKSLKVNA